ncbi:MAG TPA: hypothetical protein VHU89_12990 [Acidobacteriaceae bacterium]|nr:hypothetical protein [Acidobacteriaceae bacterium]
MYWRKSLGYALYPLLVVLLLASLTLRAQSTSSPNQDQQQDPQNQSPSQSSPASIVPPESNQPALQQTSPEQRAQVLREAQARVNARRKIRIRQIIADTYSHKYEVTFGGAYLRFSPGSSLQRVNEAGWQIAVTDFRYGNFGLTADFRGYYGTSYTGTNPYSVFNPSISQYTFLGGGTYRFFRGQHWTWTAQGLAGAGHGNFGTGTNGLPPQLVGLFTDSTALNVDVGASADYNLGPALALRFNANDLFTDYNSTFKENRGAGLGMVYRFGHR